MKTLQAAILAAMMLIAGPAFGQTLIGEWHLVKSFCEGGRVLSDWSKSNHRRIFDDVSKTMITDMSHMDDQFKTKNCALNVKMNYSITGNQYKVGPFLEVSSPKCPIASKTTRQLMKYLPSHLKEQYGGNTVRMITNLQRIKEGNAPPISFKISNDNQKLWTFLPVGEDESCLDTRYAHHYKRIR